MERQTGRFAEGRGERERGGERGVEAAVSDIAEEAEQFGEDIKKEFGFRDVFYTYIGTTIGSNCGPGLMAAFFVGKKRTN